MGTSGSASFNIRSFAAVAIDADHACRNTGKEQGRGDEPDPWRYRFFYFLCCADLNVDNFIDK